MKWLVVLLLAAVGVYGLWHLKGVGEEREAARQATQVAEEKVRAERRAVTCAPVQEASTVLKKLGRADLIKHKDFCLQAKGGNCSTSVGFFRASLYLENSRVS